MGRVRGAFVCVGMVGCRLGVELREKTGSTEPWPVAGSSEDKASGGGGKTEEGDDRCLEMRVVNVL